jgi:hypothetical protein
MADSVEGEEGECVYRVEANQKMRPAQFAAAGGGRPPCRRRAAAAVPPLLRPTPVAGFRPQLLSLSKFV